MTYQFKQQTAEHKATMKVMCKFLMDEGYTQDDIIDAGDYLLENMSVAELTGAKDDKQRSKKKGTKGTDSEPVADKPAKPAKEGKVKEGKKGKGKKAKGKGSSKQKV